MEGEALLGHILSCLAGGYPPRLLCIVLLAAMISGVFADGHAPDDQQADTPRHLTRELNLNESQRTALRERMQKNRVEFARLQQQREQLRNQLEDLFADQEADEQQILSTGERLAEINAEITRSQISSRLALRRTLTPEQHSRLLQLRESTHERRMPPRPPHSRPSVGRSVERPLRGHSRARPAPANDDDD